MSINLGNEGQAAARTLQVNAGAHFTALRAALGEAMRRSMHHALESDHTARADAVGYARALRDVCMALDADAEGRKITPLDKPSPMKVGARHAIA